MTETTGAYNFDGYKDDALTRPRDEAWSNWKSWKDAQVGDKVQGYIADAFYRPEEKDEQGVVQFREQRGITLKLLDGTFQNVGVKYLDFVLPATDNLRVGDPLTIELSKLGEKQKGKQQAKIFSYYGTNLPANASNKTVKQLTDEDKSKGGSVQPVEKDVDEDSAAADADFDNMAPVPEEE